VATAAATEALRLVGQYAEAQEVAGIEDWLHIGCNVVTAQGRGVVIGIADPEIQGGERIVTVKLPPPLVTAEVPKEGAATEGRGCDELVPELKAKVEPKGIDVRMAAGAMRPDQGQGSVRPAVGFSLPMAFQVAVARKCLEAAASKVSSLSIRAVICVIVFMRCSCSCHFVHGTRSCRRARW
jgi:hypothetical protein